jgi:flagellar basal body P-ring formation protein FlgA
MSYKKVIAVIVMTIVLMQGVVCAEEAGLEIYLPREIAVDSNVIRLGQVAIIRGEVALAAKASEIGLGNFAVPGQKITIDKKTILGRLVANNIFAAAVSLQGSEQVTVKQQEQLISGSEFIKQAINVLKKMPAYSTAERYYPIRTPADLAIPFGCKEVKLVPRLSAGSTTALAKVEFAVFAGEKEVGRRDVTVRLTKERQNIAAAAAVAARQAEGDTDKKDLAAQSQAGGLKIEVAETVAENQTSKVRVVINRNQNVVIKIDRSGLMITAAGKALQKGSVGENIKVQNIDSNRVIVARINEDGSVEPVF